LPVDVNLKSDQVNSNRNDYVMFVIINLENNGYWNNQHGWTELDEATQFTEDETKIFSAPADSYWVAISEIEKLNMARLIVAANTIGLFSLEDRRLDLFLQLLAEMGGCYGSDIQGIIDNAKHYVENFKKYA
jgi:hypothetical protein